MCSDMDARSGWQLDIYTPFNSNSIMHSPRNGTSPLFSLPTELFLTIGDYLDIFTLSTLQITCHALRGIFNHQHMKRLAYLLGLYVKFHQIFDLVNEEDREYDQTLREACETLKEGKDICIFEDDIMGREWITTKFLLQFAKQLHSQDRLQKMLEMNAAWGRSKDIHIVLSGIIQNGRRRQDHGEHSDIVQMLAKRYLELDGEKRFDLVSYSLWYLQIRYSRLLREVFGFGEVERLSLDTWQQLFRCCHGNLFRLRSVQWLRPDNAAPRDIVKLVQYVVEEIGVEIPTEYLETFIERLITSGNTYEDCHDSREVFQEFGGAIADILKFFGRHGVNLQAFANHELADIHWFDNSFVLKAFGKAGCYLGPFDEGVRNVRIHRICNRSHECDTEYLELLLKQGCNVDLKDENGDTPLLLTLRFLTHWPPRMSHLQSSNEAVLPSYWSTETHDGEFPEYTMSEDIQFFLKNGADPFTVGANGETAITIAMILGAQDIIEDMINWDTRREERYGNLSPQEVYNRWITDDKMWTQQLLYPGTRQRAELEDLYRGKLLLTSTRCLFDEPEIELESQYLLAPKQVLSPKTDPT
ncbi:hypothetical protein BJ508DRAFT_311319 [Ascobolus immersus RN42]|uniref:F-box domain-containing protein n=1 Tax=Ascobolus immersus RN42 TaxID=1160509 RepID=A0A3N4I2Y1_ASCIM|nr:hypothetical protein BJ508DRAFT_311319 [Ascobolus immersus RN42]